MPVGPDEKAVEEANQQGFDDTCGARTVVMAAVEDGLLAVDQGQDKALVDELWQLVNPGVSEFSTGMTLDQQEQCILHVGNTYGKRTTLCPLRPTEHDDAATAGAGPGTRLFPTVDPPLAIEHMTAAVNLTRLLGIDSDHFILKRKDDVDAGEDGQWEILDSCHDVDGDPDHFATSLVVAAAADLFGAGRQFGWAWTWSEPT